MNEHRTDHPLTAPQDKPVMRWSFGNYRSDLPRIIPDEKPGLLNQETLYGAWLGSIAGSLVAFLAGIARAPSKMIGGIALAGTAIGTYYGSIESKKEYEREQREGRVVKTPSYLNAGTFGGVILVDGIFTIADMFETKGKFTSFSAPYFALMGAAATIGSIIRHDQLQLDFNKAVAIRDEQTLELHKKLNAALVSKPEISTPSPHAQQITNETLASSVENAR